MDSKTLSWKIKKRSLDMAHRSNGSHIACVLSVADVIAVLYGSAMNVNSQNPQMAERDKLILSKGHAGAAVYVALAECGFFHVDELKTHNMNGSVLSGHVSHKGVPGVEFSTGSLGHGLAVGAGMALANMKDDNPGKVFVVMGDGECNEGSIWEAAMFANHFQLANLTAIIDHNKMQSLDYCENTIKLDPLKDKWKSFGWNVIEVDGHNHLEIENAILWGKNKNPTVIIAHTIKGKGISFMENNIEWHYRAPNDEQYKLAQEELEAQRP